MDTISAGLWGGYFVTVAFMLAGAGFAVSRGLRRIGANAAIAALVSSVFVVAYLGGLPISDPATLARVQAHVAMLTSSLLATFLIYLLGFFSQGDLGRRAVAWLAGLGAGVVATGWLLSPMGALWLSSTISCVLGVLALGLALRSARRGERAAWTASVAVGCMLVAIFGLSWAALAGGQVPWVVHAVSALGATTYLAVLAVAMWGRYAYLIEVRQVLALGPAWDPVTRLPNHSETINMAGEVFQRHSGERMAIGIVIVTISNFYALEKLHGRAAVNHALFVCAGRLRRSVNQQVVIGRLGEDGFLLLWRNLSSPEQLVTLSRLLVSRLSKPVVLGTRQPPGHIKKNQTRWEADLGLGVMATADTRLRAVSVIDKVQAMSRTAWSYSGRIAWYNQELRQIAELPLDAR